LCAGPIPRAHAAAGMLAPLPAGISGLAALNPGMAGIVNAVPPHLDPATVPIQEGWVKLRGIPFTVTKADICKFFEVGCARVPAAISPLSTCRACVCSPHEAEHGTWLVLHRAAET
jgi:hypothetical protein